MQIHTEANWSIQALRDIQPPPHIPEKFFTTFLLLCCWHIWKRRNNFVFRNDRITLNAALAICKTEAHLWGARLLRSDRSVATTWCSVIASAM
jgi:hypothetical protein